VLELWVRTEDICYLPVLLTGTKALIELGLAVTVCLCQTVPHVEASPYAAFTEVSRSAAG
jgi:hypothetical protein